jgi:hypothetical protein
MSSTFIYQITIKYTVTPCINNIQNFIFQLTHTTLKNVELLTYLKISKTVPTCFGLQENHHQGATAARQQCAGAQAQTHQALRVSVLIPATGELTPPRGQPQNLRPNTAG